MKIQFLYVLDFNYSLSLEGKIICGQNVSTGKTNFLVSYRHKDEHKCSGFLTSTNYVLTQAHCLNEFFVEIVVPNFNEYSVYTGHYKNLKIIGVNYRIKEVISHKSYDPYNPKPTFDMGLIKVNHQYILIISDSMS